MPCADQIALHPVGEDGGGACCENSIVSLLFNTGRGQRLFYAHDSNRVCRGCWRRLSLSRPLTNTRRPGVDGGIVERHLRGVEMEEHWTAPKGNSMIGIHRDIGKGRTMLFEFLRIEQQGDQIVYLSMPNGRSPATPFPLKEVSGTRVVFENPDA